MAANIARSFTLELLSITFTYSHLSASLTNKIKKQKSWLIAIALANEAENSLVFFSRHSHTHTQLSQLCLLKTKLVVVVVCLSVSHVIIVEECELEKEIERKKFPTFLSFTQILFYLSLYYITSRISTYCLTGLAENCKSQIKRREQVWVSVRTQ